MALLVLAMVIAAAVISKAACFLHGDIGTASFYNPLYIHDNRFFPFFSSPTSPKQLSCWKSKSSSFHLLIMQLRNVTVIANNSFHIGICFLLLVRDSGTMVLPVGGVTGMLLQLLHTGMEEKSI
ncbi:hypothetical protein V6N13_043517 [Hibiscus sabdariffa]|uniref:Uncharacterized protein n=1 Tax=Hibiscus sabdariffa TaxID=183260 RepID=A0ABR2G261_9ROSI